MPTVVNESILNSTKKLLGIPEEYDEFDMDVQIHINSVFSVLAQIGAGPDLGYQITGPEEKWQDFLGVNPLINQIKSYMYMQVRLWFDPPATSFTIDSFTKAVEEMKWRIQIAVDTPEGDSIYAAFWWALEEGEDFPPEASIGDIGYNPTTGQVWRNI